MHRVPAVESQRIDDVTNTIKEVKKSLEICVDRLDHEALAKINNTSTSTSSEVKAIRQTMHRHYGIMMKAIGDIANHQRESRFQDGEGIKNVFKECFQEILSSTMQTGLYRLLEENEYCRSKHLSPFLTLRK